MNGTLWGQEMRLILHSRNENNNNHISNDTNNTRNMYLYKYMQKDRRI